jgi:hypothetical protein
MDANSIFNSVLVLSGLVVLVSEWVSKLTKLQGNWSRLQSWVISVILGVVATWVKIGIFSEMDWKGGLAIGIVSGLVANGVFDISVVKRVLEFIKLRAEKNPN